MLFNHCLNSQYESVSILTKSYLKCVGGAVQQNLLYGDLLRAFGFLPSIAPCRVVIAFLYSPVLTGNVYTVDMTFGRDSSIAH